MLLNNQWIIGWIHSNHMDHSNHTESLEIKEEIKKRNHLKTSKQNDPKPIWYSEYSGSHSVASNSLQPNGL